MLPPSNYTNVIRSPRYPILADTVPGETLFLVDDERLESTAIDVPRYTGVDANTGETLWETTVPQVDDSLEVNADGFRENVGVVEDIDSAESRLDVKTGEIVPEIDDLSAFSDPTRKYTVRFLDGDGNGLEMLVDGEPVWDNTDLTVDAERIAWGPDVLWLSLEGGANTEVRYVKVDAESGEVIDEFPQNLDGRVTTANDTHAIVEYREDGPARWGAMTV